MKLTAIKPHIRVAFVPMHAHGDVNHSDVELGTVSSTNSKYAWVKFDKQLEKFGWDNTTSQPCCPEDLIPM